MTVAASLAVIAQPTTGILLPTNAPISRVIFTRPNHFIDSQFLHRFVDGDKKEKFGGRQVGMNPKRIPILHVLAHFYEA